jgi:hypothetical protein
MPLCPARFFASAICAMTTMVMLISPPPPMPCTARNAMSSAMVCAIPHSAEPARNTAIAPMNTRFAP